MVCTARMFASLAGLSVGDAFGECFFRPATVAHCLSDRVPPPPPWYWTDDTNMALSIAGVLAELGTIEQDTLARSFGEHFDGARGYGRAMHSLLPRYARGADWRREAPALFAGMGSYGNGAAMRVAPLGAYFAEDLDRVVEEAGKAAEVTHAHPEGIAGAIGVAVAAALAADRDLQPASFVEGVIERTPDSEVRTRLQLIEQIRPDSALRDVVALLGNGSRITAQDTVAFAVWSAAQHLGDFAESLWLTVGAGGDVDTTCAIVGGIVGARVGIEGIPPDWLARREPLPRWAPMQ
jgi:ADP-ribosylglycohydrolase